MRILAIDTSTKFLCLGIYDNGKVYEYNLEVSRKLSSLITIVIKRALGALGLNVSDIDYFACGLGPGSFTGIRVGVSTIKGLSWAVKKPVIGVSTLDILAENSPDTDKDIVPVIDAKRSLIYTSVFRKKDGQVKRIAPYMLLDEKGFLDKVKRDSVIFGDALGLYREKILPNVRGGSILDRDYWYPLPRNIIRCALERIRERKISNCFDIKPIYLYPKECQIANSKQ